MTTESQEAITQPEGGEGEGQGNESETISISKKDYEDLNRTIGSLKRENKDLKKPKEESTETPKTNQKPDDALLKELADLRQRTEKQSLRTAGITNQEDIELAMNTAKKWNMDIDEVLADEDFKAKLERQQTTRANVEATSGVRGTGSGQASAKNTPEYWQAKGTPPTPADVPDAVTRRKIVRSMMNASKGNGRMKFYNS